MWWGYGLELALRRAPHRAEMLVVRQAEAAAMWWGYGLELALRRAPHRAEMLVVPCLISLTSLALWKWDTSIPERNGHFSRPLTLFDIGAATVVHVGAVANPQWGLAPGRPVIKREAEEDWGH
jgi:hypothetical protein